MTARRYRKGLERVLLLAVEHARTARARIEATRDPQEELKGRLVAATEVTLPEDPDGEDQHEAAVAAQDALEDAAIEASILADYYSAVAKSLSGAVMLLTRAVKGK